MPAIEERSAGFIIFHRTTPDNVVRYLLLDYGEHWDFAKGHLETGESDLQAARRELAEETGVTDIALVPGFARRITYFFRHRRRGLVRKNVIFFLAEAKNQGVVLSPEHTSHAWLPAMEAESLVTYANAREVLREADMFLRVSSASSSR